MEPNNTRMTIEELCSNNNKDDDCVDRDEFVIEEEYTNNWQFGKDLKERERVDIKTDPLSLEGNGTITLI